MASSPGDRPYAFVSLVTTDAYLPGALVLAAALRDLHSTKTSPPHFPFQIVCLVTPESVDVATVRALSQAFDLVVGVELIAQEDKRGLQLLGRPDLNTVLTKLHVFRLTQFSKIIFLDADVLPIRPLSHLFVLSHDFSAVPDVGWPDIFNSGVMVLTPGEDRFAELTQLLASKGSWDGGDQGILNEWRAGNWNRLSFTYNTTPTAAYTYAPAYERYGSQISAIHFIGPNKPWNNLPYRVPFDHSTVLSQTYDYNSLVNRWFAVYDKHYRNKQSAPQTQFRVTPYIPVWGERSDGTTASAPTRTLTLEELKRLAIEGMNAFSCFPDDGNFRVPALSNGKYQSLPLEGRVDLMRRKTDRHDAKSGENPSENAPPIAMDRDRPQGPGNGPEGPHTLPANSASLLLPTPGSNEFPQTPQPRTISLPPVTPTPLPASLRHPAPSLPESPSPFQSAPLYPESSLPNQVLPKLQPSHKSDHENLVTPRRDRSPTRIFWNPAFEAPPSSLVGPYNRAAASPWRGDYMQINRLPTAFTTPPEPSALFEPPPLSDIPASLIQNGNYRNVTGDNEFGFVPSPDRTKVKNVFPWEERPRPPPRRVFPATDSPKPSLSLSPETASSSELPTTPEPKSGRLATFLSPLTGGLSSVPDLSPLVGLPVGINYANAWDAVPSIQKYAERLVQPMTPRQPLAPPFEDRKRGGRVSKNWDARVEVNSQDGDVEDEGDETSDEEPPRAVLRVSDSDNSPSSLRQWPNNELSKNTEREYRDIGVQTDPRELRDEGIQVESPLLEPSYSKGGEKGQRSTATGKKWWALSSKQDSPLMTTHDVDEPDRLSTHAPASPRTERLPLPSSPLRSPISSVSSPRTSLVPSLAPPKVAILRPISPLSFTASPPAISSQASNDSTLASPSSSSIGPPSPSDGHSSLNDSPRPARKAQRVWDPARGVEIFKRGSEEVLARFLRTRSWEDEQR